MAKSAICSNLKMTSLSGIFLNNPEQTYHHFLTVYIFGFYGCDYIVDFMEKTEKDYGKKI